MNAETEARVPVPSDQEERWAWDANPPATDWADAPTGTHDSGDCQARPVAYTRQAYPGPTVTQRIVRGVELVPATEFNRVLGLLERVAAERDALRTQVAALNQVLRRLDAAWDAGHPPV